MAIVTTNRAPKDLNSFFGVFDFNYIENFEQELLDKYSIEKEYFDFLVDAFDVKLFSAIDQIDLKVLYLSIGEMLPLYEFWLLPIIYLNFVNGKTLSGFNPTFYELMINLDKYKLNKKLSLTLSDKQTSKINKI